ncbi:7047_t:CDS:2 [Dentiscutata erythropus]|uniref:7047_t:CDS:1 n=1 Tax=Dentiscutata erythropus TaxID=1348616 RepID=A0A9N9D3X6_9GLOM|nr:7047_t:CDS:2 [Dentiscutata erythropus]
MSLLSVLSSCLTDWTSLILVLLIIYISNFYYNYFMRPNPLPGPIPIPILGTIHIIGMNPLTWYNKNKKKAGTIWEFYIGSQRNIVINHAKHAEKLCKPTKSFFKRFPFPMFERMGLNHGIFFNNDYNLWHRRRRLVIRALMATKFLRGLVLCIQNQFKASEERWKSKIKDGIEFDFSEWMRYFATDIQTIQTTKQHSYCVALFDTNKKLVQSEEIKKSLEFTNATKKFFHSFGFFIYIPPFIWDYVPGFNLYSKSCERNINYLNDVVNNIINKRKKELEEGAELDSDLLDHLLIAHTLKDPDSKNNDNVAPITAKEVTALTWDILLAGTDSTGNAFSFLLYYIAKNPNVLAKIHKEIDEIFGPDSNIEFTLEKLDNCHYIEATIKESLRLILLGPYTAKISDGIQNIAGYNWPSGTRFWIDHQTLCNNPDYWEDNETFNPDRFLNKNHGGSSELSNFQKISFTPFGCGLRSCAGKLVAMNVMKSLVVLFYRKYNIELKNENIKYHYSALNQVYDLKIRIRLRDGSSL